MTVLFVLRVLATRRFEVDYPAPGKMVDVGGFSMHLNCTGSGTPPVVLEAGYIDFSIGWSKVQPLVAQFTKVCSYDRSGLLWSELSPRPRSADAVVDELAALIEAGEIETPVVLVGHSLGGLLTTYFARKYRARVAGLVLVDSTTENSRARKPPELKELEAPMTIRQVKIAKVLARLGFLRLLPVDALGPPPESGLDLETRRVYAAGYASLPRFWDAAIADAGAASQYQGQVREAGFPSSLQDLPLVYLLAGEPDWEPGSGWTEELIARSKALSRELAEETAELSSRGEVVFVPEASHDIQRDAPDEVAAAIKRVVDLHRSDGS